MTGSQSAAPARKLKTRPAAGPNKSVTVHIAGDQLKSVYVYVNELNDTAQEELGGGQGGTVTLVAESGKKFGRVLKKCWFPAGVWMLNMGKNGIADSFTCVYPPDMPPSAIAAVHNHGERDLVLSWIQGTSDEEELLKLVRQSHGKQVRLVVSYSKAHTGNAKTLPETVPLTDENANLLSDEALALMYLRFVEHFGRVSVELSLAKGGLTDAEVAQVEGNRPEIIEITNLFTQGYSEFKKARASASPPLDLEAFQAMEEAIFYQRKVRNDLADRNLLTIGTGLLLRTRDDGSRELVSDVGVLRRTAGPGQGILLYDRYGMAVRGIIGGYLDTEYRSVDLTKIQRDTGIPFMDILVSDAALYRFLRSLEQSLGQPLREVEALAASLYKHTLFISDEIHRRYRGEIGDRILSLVPAAIAFFVAHAIAGFLIRTGHPAGIAFMVLLKGAGLLMGFDFALLNMERLTEAGRHFARLEELHRERPGQKPELTALSRHHLRAGSAALLDAMADFIAMGVIIFGSVAGCRLGPALRAGMKKLASTARSKVTVKEGKIVEIQATNPEASVEVPTPKEGEGTGGVETRGKSDAVPDQHPVETPNSYVGDQQHGQVPRPKPLPRKPRGPQKKAQLDALYAEAPAAQAELTELTRDIAQQLGGEAVVPETLKSRGRAAEKVNADYDGDASQLVDLARTSIVFRRMSQLRAALEQIRARAKVIRVKDRFAKPVDGYRDMLLNIEMSNGHVAELQLHLEQILKVKDGPGHPLYEQTREIKARAKIENRVLTPDEEARHADLTEQQRILYDQAYEASQAEGPSGQQPPEEK